MPLVFVEYPDKNNWLSSMTMASKPLVGIFHCVAHVAPSQKASKAWRARGGTYLKI